MHYPLVLIFLSQEIQLTMFWAEEYIVLRLLIVRLETMSYLTLAERCV